MPQVINTNLMSLVAQNALNGTQSQLSTAMQRLSTGLRINSAADDAAGFAIATGMQSQINGDTVAERNANDGISLAQTAGSALSQITNDLQTIRQLAVQSSNATNTAANRQTINSEVQQEVAEVTRIAQQTTYNGKSLLTGVLGTATFQIGANVGQTISVDLSQGSQASQIGQLATASSSSASSAFSTGIVLDASDSLSVTYGASGTATAVAANTYTTAAALATAINTAATASNGGTAVTIAAADGNQVKITAGAADAVSFTTTGTASALGFSNVAAGATADSTGVASALTSTSPLTLAAGDFTIQSGSAAAVDITGTFSSLQDLVSGINAQGIPGVSAYVDSTGSLQITSQSALTIDGAKAGTGTGDLGFSGTGTAIATSGNLAGVDVKTVDDSNVAIARVDAAIAQVSSAQSTLGAMQNRFDSVVANLQSGAENLSAAQSRIEDADFAKETAALSKAQILQQAGVSMLAQANAQPQLVLKLLQ